MAESAGVSGAYDAAKAGRHLALGWRAPRAAMREAAGIGERGRLCLVAVSGAIVLLADPAEDGFPRFVAGQAEGKATPAAVSGEVALWGFGALAVLIVLYAATAGLLWLFTRPGPAKPSFATLRSGVAVASWIATLPMLAAGLACSALGLDLTGGLLIFGLWTAYAGLCLSEAAGLDARAGTGLALGSAVLASLAIAAGIAGLYVGLIHEDALSLAEGLTP